MNYGPTTIAGHSVLVTSMIPSGFIYIHPWFHPFLTFAMYHCPRLNHEPRA